ncbi:MAG: FAD binding domain-containing protein [Bacteroidales bacterium]|nr:FAD binding domain-containing protein [Bacteroidales bacterium]
MIEFILNNKHIQTNEPPGMPLLDFIRYTMDLTGTKSGCREGDCGACTVMEGSLNNNELKYKTIVSCLTPLGNVQGKHIVTVEGLNMNHLSPAQKAIVEQGGTQCGFCTPGFVVSLTSHSLTDDAGDPEKTRAALDGNICRCTGYKSIERAATALADSFSGRNGENTLEQLVATGHLPAYFNGIAERLKKIRKLAEPMKTNGILLAGGTDLLVQKSDEIAEGELTFLQDKKELKGIAVQDNICTIGAATTAAEISGSAELQAHFPALQSHFKLISSTPIRNMGTLGGNLVNASPIGDLSIFFLALDAELKLQDNKGKQRRISLKDFFLNYKKLALKSREIIESLRFRLPEKDEYFNFEKVSKRQHLDIASVNTAIHLHIENDFITKAALAAGGVSPVPFFLVKTSKFLTGQRLDEATLLQANEIMQDEISPISDIRGSEAYKRLLLRQLFFAHFLTIKPELFKLRNLLTK